MGASIRSIGTPLACGAYLLRINLEQTTQLAFGRFKGGERIELKRGTYLYVGSAMARKGSTSLSHRLLRHSRRSGDRPVHRIHTALAQHLHALSLLPTPLAPASTKKLRWHIDHLLDLSTAELAAVYLLHSAISLEAPLASFFAADPHTTIFVPGLGANDAPGHTHLFYCAATTSWWNALNERLCSAFYCSA